MRQAGPKDGPFLPLVWDTEGRGKISSAGILQEDGYCKGMHGARSLRGRGGMIRYFGSQFGGRGPRESEETKTCAWLLLKEAVDQSHQRSALTSARARQHARRVAAIVAKQESLFWCGDEGHKKKMNRVAAD